MQDTSSRKFKSLLCHEFTRRRKGRKGGDAYCWGVVMRRAVVVDRAAERGGRLGLRLAPLLARGEVLVAAEAGAGELLLVLLPHLADLGEVHGVVRQRAVLHVPVPERRHRHPPVRTRRVVAPLLHAQSEIVRTDLVARGFSGWTDSSSS
jgi:hypothetical protein